MYSTTLYHCCTFVPSYGSIFYYHFSAIKLFTNVYCACTVRLLYCNMYGNTSGSTSFLTTLVVALQLEYSLSTKYVYSRTTLRITRAVQRCTVRVRVQLHIVISHVRKYGSVLPYFRTKVRKYFRIYLQICTRRPR